MSNEKLGTADGVGASVTRMGDGHETGTVCGHYWVECYDAWGNLKWKDDFDNVVTTVGKNHMLDNYLAGSAFTQTGPYIGLISSVSYGAGPAAGDTMSSHAGWTEAGGANAPTYTSPRKTAAFAAASGGSKALSANLTYAITGSGTIKGAFMVLGTGAVSTIDSTAGTLFSAGLFTTGDKIVASSDTVNVSWSLSV